MSGAPAARRAGGEPIAAVVVDHDAGQVLAGCCESLLAEGVAQVVVVENGGPGAARALAAGGPGAAVTVIGPGVNLGYGAGVNRGVAATAGGGPYVLVANPDLEVGPGALAALAAVLETHPATAIVGPRILTAEGEAYPSARRFPSVVDAVGHALLEVVHPDNPFSRRYRPPPPQGDQPVATDWVSGACFLARRSAFEELGGFDEGYFMYAEDMDLCWRAARAGWAVEYQPGAVVTHFGGRSTRQRPYAMVVAHHRSALRFARRTTTGWKRLALPLAAAVLGLRLAVALLGTALGRRA